MRNSEAGAQILVCPTLKLFVILLSHPQRCGTSCWESCSHKTAMELTPPPCAPRYGLMTHAVSRDLSMACRMKTRPSPAVPQYLFGISHNFCCTQPAFLSVSWIYCPLTSTKHLLQFFWLKMVTSLHSRALSGPALQQGHASPDSRWDLVFL